MDFEHTDKVKALIAVLEAFMDKPIYPNEAAHRAWTTDPANLWRCWPGIATLKTDARRAGLRNLFVPQIREYNAINQR